MRNATRNALFNDEEYIVLWKDDTTYGVLTLVSVGGKTAIIHEYPNRDNGFEVYVRCSGYGVYGARASMGLPPEKGETK